MRLRGFLPRLPVFRMLGGLVAACLALVLIAWSRPYPADKLAEGQALSTRFLDRSGALMFERPRPTGGYQARVALTEIAPAVIHATLAGEDHRFYEHFGIDPAGVLRATALNLQAGSFAYGGSTITQQLAKLLDRQPRTLFGKTLEAFGALRLERTLSKDALLSEYLNRVYYGRQAYGIEAAARRFYNKPAILLTLGEATLLAILPRAPTRYSPDTSPEVARARRAHVLGRMALRGYLTAEEASAAAIEPITLVELRSAPEARHVVDEILPIKTDTADVRLSVDLPLQSALQRSLDKHLLDIRQFGASQGGIVVVENASGGILAMVGSRDYHDKVALGSNNAATALRPAGSTLKPFIYGLAFESGYTERSTLLDAPSEWADYEPRSSRNHYHGVVTFGEALASSLNLPAVKLNASLGPERVAQRLRQFGFSQVDPSGKKHGLALALGGARVTLVELATAYAALARGGLWQPSHLVTPSAPVKSERVMTEQASSEVTQILQSAQLRRLEFGLETPLELGFSVAAKTGTSSNFGDNWAVGYTEEFTVAVWVGNFDGRPLLGSLAMTGAAPLFHDAMQHAVAGATELHGGRDDHTGHRARPMPPLSTAKRLIEAFRITSPRPDAELIIDDALPAKNQRIPLRTSHATLPRGSMLRWTVDGRPFEPKDGTLSWPLSPGTHEFIASVSDLSGQVTQVSDPVSVVVQGAQDVYAL